MQTQNEYTAAIKLFCSRFIHDLFLNNAHVISTTIIMSTMITVAPKPAESPETKLLSCPVIVNQIYPHTHKNELFYCIFV